MSNLSPHSEILLSEYRKIRPQLEQLLEIQDIIKLNLLILKLVYYHLLVVWVQQSLQYSVF